MTVEELIKELQMLPPHVRVEVNDNRGGEIHNLDQVDYFNDEIDGEIVILQVNC